MAGGRAGVGSDRKYLQNMTLPPFSGAYPRPAHGIGSPSGQDSPGNLAKKAQNCALSSRIRGTRVATHVQQSYCAEGEVTPGLARSRLR